MTLLVTVPLLLACLAGAGWSAFAAARSLPVSNRQLVALAVLEVLTVVQLLVAIGSVVTGQHPDSSLTFLLYAGLAPLVVPVGVFWAAAEKSRSGILVITVTCVAVAVMTLRMVEMWRSAHG